jgi:hypothetical protein
MALLCCWGHRLLLGAPACSLTLLLLLLLPLEEAPGR